MWQIILGFLSGPLKQVSNDLKEAYQSKLSAANDAERIAADERIAILEARKSTVLASQSSPVERWVRLGFALPFILYINKLVVWDKILAWGVTDPLSSDLTNLMWIVIGGYFIDATVKGTARILKK